MRLLFVFVFLSVAQLTEWRQRKFDELNAPLAEADSWVHKKVLHGERAFTNLRDNRRI